MIVAQRGVGDREMRFGANTNITPRRYGSMSWSGVQVTTDEAVGLSAVGRAIRLVSGVIASMPILVFEGTGGERRERADTSIARLLANPYAGMSDFDWRWDVAASLESTENAFLLKVRSRGKVVELQPIPTDCVYAYIDGGRKRFDVWTDDGPATLTDQDVLHIRGQTVGGGPFGVSRIQQHADPMGSLVAAQQFEGSFMRNHARPDLAILFPQGVTKKQADEWRDGWDAEYGGPFNAGKPVPLGGGATIQPIPVSLRDAQFVEGRQFGIEEAGRIMDVDSALLGAPEDADVRSTALELFLRLQLPPRLMRIARALRADLDLFSLNDSLYPQFSVDDLMFADPLTRAQVQHFRIQNGSELVDEARADNGRPPLPDGAGQIPQITPVGGAPNPAADDGEDTDEDTDEDDTE